MAGRPLLAFAFRSTEKQGVIQPQASDQKQGDQVNDGQAGVQKCDDYNRQSKRGYNRESNPEDSPRLPVIKQQQGDDQQGCEGNCFDGHCDSPASSLAKIDVNPPVRVLAPMF